MQPVCCDEPWLKSGGDGALSHTDRARGVYVIYWGPLSRAQAVSSPGPRLKAVPFQPRFVQERAGRVPGRINKSRCI